MAAGGSSPGAFLQHASKILQTDEAYRKNVAAWLPVLTKFEEGLEWAAGEGQARHIEYVFCEHIGVCNYSWFSMLMDDLSGDIIHAACSPVRFPAYF